MTEEPTDMDEAKLRVLLQRGERPIAPSVEQRDRIRNRIWPALEVEQGGGNTAGGVIGQDRLVMEGDEPLELVLDIPAPTAAARPLWTAAAVLIVAVLAGLVFAIVRDNDVVSVADPQAAAPSVSAPSCPAEISEFLDAIDLWGGVENWSFVTDASAPQPDLLTLAITALEWELVASESANADLIERLQLISEAPLDRRLRPVDREERFEAVLSAQVAVENVVMDDRQLSNCSGGNLDAESSAEDSR